MGEGLNVVDNKEILCDESSEPPQTWRNLRSTAPDASSTVGRHPFHTHTLPSGELAPGLSRHRAGDDPRPHHGGGIWPPQRLLLSEKTL